MNKDQNIINFKEVKFISMNGAGNKLLIHDSRNQKLSITKELLKFLLDKDELISFDQFIQILSPDKNGDVKVLFWNADGSEAEMCGNGIR